MAAIPEPQTAVSDIAPARRSAEQLAAAFEQAVPALTPAQALVEAERCLSCFDAPCVQACPTGIDVPRFIRRIADGNLRGAAHAILDANPLAGTCARVCPTEVLCEQVCVRNTQHGRPLDIGRLQRHAVDAVMAQPVASLFARAPASGRRVAVVGAGPAGLACAFGLARRGHDVVLHDARPSAGGLNEYGVAAYKMAGGFAQAELNWLLGIGGIDLQLGWRLAGADQLAALRARFDAVYLALGLTRTPQLGVAGERLAGVRDAVDFIAELRQTRQLAALPIGRRIVVIGGGMTAIDAAVQSRLLGAHSVHIVYRRGPEQMSASVAEREWAQTQGVMIHHQLAPHEILGQGGQVFAVRFARTDGSDTHETFAADMVFKAIGQKLDDTMLAGSGLTLQSGRIVADADGRTGVPKLYAGGDCRTQDLDLTVQAVQDGKRAAAAIHDELA